MPVPSSQLRNAPHTGCQCCGPVRRFQATWLQPNALAGVFCISDSCPLYRSGFQHSHGLQNTATTRQHATQPNANTFLNNTKMLFPSRCTAAAHTQHTYMPTNPFPQAFSSLPNRAKYLECRIKQTQPHMPGTHKQTCKAQTNSHLQRC